MNPFFRDINLRSIFVPCFVILSLLVALVTLPPALMDLLLSISIALSIVILMTTFFIRKPLEFSIFPTLLLITTLFRLTMNVATTRLILTRAGEAGDLAAGEVIKTFSSFVTGESLVVGIVIFTLFIVIQFVVITKGATRISEVAARFTLDAMPGRQMAIDADLNAGSISEEKARELRQELTAQSDFFGAMDGAGKFVRGDAVASIIITFVNIIGGLFIGVVQQKMNLTDALSLYTTLTIGDGLVAQIPALLISMATGILVTRCRESSDLPNQVIHQLFLRPESLLFTALFLTILAFTGMPPVPFLATAIVLIFGAFLLHRKKQKEESDLLSNSQKNSADQRLKEKERVENYLIIDPIELELGVGLLSLANEDHKEEFIEHLRQLRCRIASDLGLLIPKIRVRDEMTLDENRYRICIDGEPVTEGILYPNLLMAKETEFSRGTIPGFQTTDPISGKKAFWIEKRNRDRSEEFGYEVIEPSEILEQNLQETLCREAEQFLTRDAVKHLIDELHQAAPAVVDELIPNLLSLSQVQQVLRLLLRERVSIRALGTIFEALGDHAKETKNPILLADYVRSRLARTLCARLRDSDKILHAVLCSPELEQQIQDSFDLTENGILLRIDPATSDSLNSRIENEIGNLKQAQFPPVFLTRPEIRFALRELTCAKFPGLNILSFQEISRDTKVSREGVLTL